MKSFYFTFGFGHFCREHGTLRNNYVRIEAPDMEAARKIMFAKRDNKWAMSYTEEEFLPQIEEYSLQEIPLDKLLPQPCPT